MQRSEDLPNGVLSIFPEELSGVQKTYNFDLSKTKVRIFANMPLPVVWSAVKASLLRSEGLVPASVAPSTYVGGTFKLCGRDRKKPI